MQRSRRSVSASNISRAAASARGMTSDGVGIGSCSAKPGWLFSVMSPQGGLGEATRAARDGTHEPRARTGAADEEISRAGGSGGVAARRLFGFAVIGQNSGRPERRNGGAQLVERSYVEIGERRYPARGGRPGPGQ